MSSLAYTSIIDISLPLHEDLPVYPGNPGVAIEHFSSASGTSFNSSFSMGTHVGTHIDAPRHTSEQGLDIDDLSLNTFIGPCRVIDLTAVTGSISADDLRGKGIKRGDRILMKTSNSMRGFETFYDDYVYLSPEGAEYLAGTGIRLVGIDAWSVKQKGSTDNRPHTFLLDKLIPILEGIDLKQVPEGDYTLLLLPLKIQAWDGAPARAVLLS